MKILWASNSPLSGSGYGVQSALFGPRIAAMGHDLAYYANFGNQGACIVDQNGFRIYPTDHEWGNRTMAACAAHHADGDNDVQMIALCDAWVLDPGAFPRDSRLAIWAPVDQWPLPEPVRHVLAQPFVTPIAMSRFGEQMMRDADLDPLYVPHGVDTTMFRPQPEIRADVRRDMNLPRDAFVVGMVAANQGSPVMHRKAFPQAFQAFARFHETHRDAVMYVHTNEYANKGGGLHLRALANRCGIPRDTIRFTEAFAYELGWPRAAVSNAYGAFDVLLNASMGEGFGVPIMEAQACGVPVIVTDHSAMPEICGAGWVVGGEDWYNGLQDAWFKAPSVDEIVFALDAAYEARGDEAVTEKARAFALRYDADVVAEEFWRPAMAALEQRMTDQLPAVTLTREVEAQVA